ncbi:MAG: nicotinate-nucleotide--dimethylbenzimidazole phosphoribosyltransferase [Crocinitomicaceae bacterium]|nr:nicotinate-nucleotide--dimethylbenzimidazole phosphoribosyltransferase [Crocinitomicaceae bacterium]
MKFSISPLSTDLNEAIEHKINFKTKPMGALGMLEEIAGKIAQIQGTLTPELSEPHILVFAGDHGLANEGVSAFPQEVTHQMVLNFLGGGAAINVFCRQHKIQLGVVDAGVNFDFGSPEGLINAKISNGTASALKGKAMSIEQVVEAIEKGAKIVQEDVSPDCNIIGFGEMGIGNTSSSALIMHYITELDIETCVGKGTGVNSEQLQKKISILKEVIEFHGRLDDPLDILSAVGGFEIAEMVGAYLQSASDRKVILVDGFIATAAYAIAHKINPAIADYAIFAHQSDEKGHAMFLGALNVDVVLNIGLRLGEGTGSALAYPLVKSAVNFLNEMSSFEDAGVSNKD